MRLDRLNRLPFAPVVGAMFGGVAAILVLATPPWLFEREVAGNGLLSLLFLPGPPLGAMSQIAAALFASALMGGLIWISLARIEAFFQPKSPLARGVRIEPATTTRPAFKAVASPPPVPLSAAQDLGAPFMSDEAIAHARDELFLDATMIVTEAPQTVRALMARLEAALDKRGTRTAEAPKPGSMEDMRSALGSALAA